MADATALTLILGMRATLEKVGNPTVSKDNIIYKLPLKVFSINI